MVKVPASEEELWWLRLWWLWLHNHQRRLLCKYHMLILSPQRKRLCTQPGNHQDKGSGMGLEVKDLAVGLEVKELAMGLEVKDLAMGLGVKDLASVQELANWCQLRWPPAASLENQTTLLLLEHEALQIWNQCCQRSRTSCHNADKMTHQAALECNRPIRQASSTKRVHRQSSSQLR